MGAGRNSGTKVKLTYSIGNILLTRQMIRDGVFRRRAHSAEKLTCGHAAPAGGTAKCCGACVKDYMRAVEAERGIHGR